jgi:hypothetical protein
MSKTLLVGHTERLKLAAEDRARRLDLFKPKPAVTDPLFEERKAMRGAELAQVRADRLKAREDKRLAAADAAQAAIQALADEAEAVRGAKKDKRKVRQALTEIEAKAKRDARYAARRAR